MAKRLSILIIALALSACAKEESADTAASAATDDKSATGAPSRSDKPARKKRVKKDRGDGSMMLGDTERQASSARAKFKDDDKLTISMGKTEGSYQTKIVRHSLDFRIRDYKGPGEYKIPMHGGIPSIYVVLGVEVPKDDNAKDADKEAEKMVMDALTGSKTVMLGGAIVTIASVTDTEVVGTFQHPGAKVPMTKGKFRAVIRKKK